MDAGSPALMDRAVHTTLLQLIGNLQHRAPSTGLLFYESFDSEPRLLSYPAMYREIRRYAESFRHQGIAKGTRVVLPFETSQRAIVSFLALIAIGALPFSVKSLALGTSIDAYEGFLSTICGKFDVKWILDLPEICGLKLGLRHLCEPKHEFHNGGDGGPWLVSGEEDLAFVQFSSGTAAFPKGIPIYHQKLMSNLDRIAGVAEKSGVDHDGCSWLPLYHDMGLIGGLLGALRLNVSLHLSNPMSFVMDPLGWLNLLSRRRIQCSVIPNFAIDYSLKYLRSTPDAVRDWDFSEMRLIYLGSEPINVTNKDEFEKRLAPARFRNTVLRPCYGMAESVLMVTCTSPRVPANILFTASGAPAISVGTPIKGCTLRLMTEDGKACADGELGEVEIRGDCLADHYFGSDQPLCNADGYYPSGDIGFVRDGELYIMGRSSDRIKINAQSYFASQFEQAIEALPFIRPGHTAVIQANQKIVVLAEITRPALLRHASRYKSRVSAKLVKEFGVKIPLEHVLFIRRNQLEKTSSGKLRRMAIAQKYTEGRIRTATAVGSRLDIFYQRTRKLVLLTRAILRSPDFRGSRTKRKSSNVAAEAESVSRTEAG